MPRIIKVLSRTPLLFTSTILVTVFVTTFGTVSIFIIVSTENLYLVTCLYLVTYTVSLAIYLSTLSRIVIVSTLTDTSLSRLSRLTTTGISVIIELDLHPDTISPTAININNNTFFTFPLYLLQN